MLPADPGAYALVLACGCAASIRIGRLGELHLQPGFYVYIGSAFGPGGLRARIGHHQRVARRPHWHIDYLRAATELRQVWYACGGTPREHDWASRIGSIPGAVIPLSGFGSSDCRCPAHLYWFARCPSARAVRRVLDRMEVAETEAPESSCTSGRLGSGRIIPKRRFE